MFSLDCSHKSKIAATVGRPYVDDYYQWQKKGFFRKGNVDGYICHVKARKMELIS